MENIEQVPHNREGCCSSVHAKIFEIFLIIGFLLALIGLALNFVLTMYFFKYSYYIFFIEIGLIAFNLCCFIFSIILRVWRSNGSVLDQKYSASICISSIILILSIINLLGSLGEDVLLYFTIGYQFGSDDKRSESRDKIFANIMNKIGDDNDDGDKYVFIKNEELNEKMTKYLPWVSMNFNAFVQILCLIFVLIIKQRIKFKSDFGTQMTMAQQGSSQNRDETKRNSGTNLGLGSNNQNIANIANNNIYEGKVENMKAKKKKSKKKKGEKKGEPAQVPDSEQIDINKKKKKKKNAKKKKNKSKKKERKNKS